MMRYDKIKELLLKYSYLGIEKTEHTEATLIGRSPRIHVYDHPWINTIFTPVGMKEIDEIEEGIGRMIPAVFVNFLTKFSNGLRIFGGTLTLYGYRYNYIREIDWILGQPFEIIPLNTYERPKNATPDMFFIGSYIYDGSKIYLTPDGIVHYCQRYDATSLLTWPSLPEMLISEIERIYSLYDEQGVQIDDTVPTTPLNLE